MKRSYQNQKLTSYSDFLFGLSTSLSFQIFFLDKRVRPLCGIMSNWKCHSMRGKKRIGFYTNYRIYWSCASLCITIVEWDNIYRVHHLKKIFQDTFIFKWRAHRYQGLYCTFENVSNVLCYILSALPVQCKWGCS